MYFRPHPYYVSACSLKHNIKSVLMLENRTSLTAHLPVCSHVGTFKVSFSEFNIRCISNRLSADDSDDIREDN